jgi:hypothetical protein
MNVALHDLVGAKITRMQAIRETPDPDVYTYSAAELQSSPMGEEEDARGSIVCSREREKLFKSGRSASMTLQRA